MRRSTSRRPIAANRIPLPSDRGVQLRRLASDKGSTSRYGPKQNAARPPATILVGKLIRRGRRRRELDCPLSRLPKDQPPKAQSRPKAYSDDSIEATPNASLPCSTVATNRNRRRRRAWPARPLRSKEYRRLR